MAIAELFEKTGLQEEDLAAFLRDAFGEIARVRAASQALSTGQRAVLSELGSDGNAADMDLLARSATFSAALEAGELSVAQVADRIGIDTSRVRHRLASGHLLGRRRGGSWRLPAWQFGDDGRPIPGLPEVLAALPGGLPLIVVWGFLTAPVPELAVSDRPRTPMEWLAGGGTAEPVIDLAAGVGLLP
jgi:hypothetical protein